MPIYAFACNNCGHLFDKLQKLSDADPDTCPACGAQGTVHRRLTAPQFRLAGGGWYETDFKKDGKRNLAGDGGDAKPAEAKPDAASAAKPKADKPAEAPKPASKPASGDAG
ncbi:zinc ribbon domain-containing protein [Pseudoluteimonas lycopersici]|uniref:Zinc ribbon domain-containing protein n=1 Tax=Pseudoluteimonas lycopersici TaxID=1324796 RepID=A0A516V7P7_9GAMM|nr:zinc ribbon domain-containing protein [Lysobacter lycopersici]QDQ74543.1 zinc ribbon domain-containing protein [Lysobacter lycopersici]